MTGAPKEVIITPFPPERGRKAIIVDGVQWGTIHMQQHGGAGNSFWFKQDGRTGEICRTKPNTLKGGGTRQHPVRVDGDKMAQRRLPLGQTVKPITERLLQEANLLIAEGLLRHPDVIKGEQDAARIVYATSRAAIETERIGNFTARAEMAIDNAKLVAALYPDDRTNLILEIVAAMTWAQSQ